MWSEPQVKTPMPKSERSAEARLWSEAAADAGDEASMIEEYSLEDSIAYQLRRTYKYFVQNLQPLLNEYDIPVGMWYFLRALWAEDGITQKEISERVGLVAPTTVEQLKNMERRGLLERRRSAKDRRKIHVFLTPEGRALRDKLLPFAPYVNRIALAGLTPGEVGFLRLVLRRMQENLLAHAADEGAFARFSEPPSQPGETVSDEN